MAVLKIQVGFFPERAVKKRGKSLYRSFAGIFEVLGADARVFRRRRDIMCEKGSSLVLPGELVTAVLAIVVLPLPLPCFI